MLLYEFIYYYLFSYYKFTDKLPHPQVSFVKFKDEAGILKKTGITGWH